MIRTDLLHSQGQWEFSCYNTTILVDSEIVGVPFCSCNGPGLHCYVYLNDVDCDDINEMDKWRSWLAGRMMDSMWYEMSFIRDAMRSLRKKTGIPYPRRKKR